MSDLVEGNENAQIAAFVTFVKEMGRSYLGLAPFSMSKFIRSN